MIAPPLETERLLLRPHRKDDFDACCAMWADPEVTRHITGRASTPQQTWSRILSYLGHWELMNFGYWAIEEKSSGQFVGEGGFADFKRDLPDELRLGPEIGFALVSRAHGKGYGTELVRELLAWGDEHLPGKTTMCLVSPANSASLRIVQKAGFGVVDDRVFNDLPTLFLWRTRPSQ